MRGSAGRLGVGSVGSLALLALAACGGGGGGGGPSVAAQATSLSATAMVTDPTASVPAITLLLTNFPSSGLYVAYRYTGNGIASMSQGGNTATSAQINVYVKPPYTLKPATYIDTVMIRVCPNQACTSQIAGSPITVTVQYVVTAVTGTSAPTLAVDRSSLVAQALPTDSLAPPPADDAILVHNAPSFQLTVNVSSTSNGVQSVSSTLPLLAFVPSSELAGPVSVTYKLPGQLAAGLYQDTITVSACLDPACVNPLVGSPQIIKISYLIGNSLPGANGDTVIQLPLHAHSLAWDPKRSVIYASVAADSKNNSNTIAVIDPIAGAVSSTTALGVEPGSLAISDDGQFLYAAQFATSKVWRLSLPALSVDATLDVGATFYTWDLAVAPGLPKTIAVARSGSPTFAGSEGVVIFDDTTARPVIAGFSGGFRTTEIDFIAWGADASTVYGADALSSAQSLTTMSVTASGAQITGSVAGITSGRVHYVGGRAYTDRGVVFDPAAGRTVGALTPPPYEFPRAVTLDGVTPRIYLLAGNGAATNFLGIYDKATLALLRTQTILGTTLSDYSFAPTPFIHWGTNGIAYASFDGQVVIIAGPFLTQ